AAFRALGGFDASFPMAAAEDRELCERWQSRGGCLVYADEAVVYHAHRLTLARYARQHFGYGRGAVHLHRARHKQGESQPRLEPMRFYRDLVHYPIARG